MSRVVKECWGNKHSVLTIKHSLSAVQNKVIFRLKNSCNKITFSVPSLCFLSLLRTSDIDRITCVTLADYPGFYRYSQPLISISRHPNGNLNCLGDRNKFKTGKETSLLLFAVRWVRATIPLHLGTMAFVWDLERITFEVQRSALLLRIRNVQVRISVQRPVIMTDIYVLFLRLSRKMIGVYRQ
jgi:hypothetical protein